MQPRTHALLVLLACGCDNNVAASRALEQPSDLAINEVELTDEQVRAAQLDFDLVDERELQATIDTSGRVAFDDSLTGHVVSPVAGRLTQIEVEIGDHVTKGQTLAIVTSPDFGGASSDFAKARAELSAAEQNNERQHALFAKHAATEVDVETAEAAYRKAKAELARARERMALLGGSGDQVTQGFRLTAPITGDVMARRARPGMEVSGQYATGGGEDLFTIGRLDRVWVLADVYEADLGRVHLGDDVDVVSSAYPGRTFPGHVDWIPIALDPEPHAARVRCAHDNPDSALRPEMLVDVTIRVGKRRGLSINRDAVFRMGSRTFAFVVRENTPPGIKRFARVPVEADEGEPSGQVEVTRGLVLGQRVVVKGVAVLRSILDNAGPRRALRETEER